MGIKKFLWSLRGQFARYFVIGIGGVILDMVSLIILKEFFGILPVLAVVMNQVFLITYVFLLNKYWSFGSKEVPHRQLVRFLILATWNYFFSVGVMYLFNQRFEFDYRLVRIFSIAMMVGWNFFLYKYWVYQAK